MALQQWVGVLTAWATLCIVLFMIARRQESPGVGQATWRSYLRRAGQALRRWIPLEETERRLAWAGRPFGLQAAEFWVMRLLLGLILGLLGFSLGPVAGLAGLATGLLVPGAWLQSQIRRRQAEMEGELLPVLDLWAAAVEAGLPPVLALNRVCERTGGLLAAEFAQAAREVLTGRPLADALLSLTDRTGIADLDLVVKTLVQAERYGTPLSRLLREMVSQIRVERRHRAQAVAGKAAVRMMIPLVLFIFAPFLVMLLAPAFWHLSGALQ